MSTNVSYVKYSALTSVNLYSSITFLIQSEMDLNTLCILPSALQVILIECSFKRGLTAGVTMTLLR